MKILDVLRIAMPLVYIAAGAALLITPVLADSITRYRPVLGGILLGYGLLRVYMWWSKRRKEAAAGTTS